MKRNKILEDRRKLIPKDIKIFISLSFSIVDRIHSILEEQGKSQKELAELLGKKESEVSRWMRGNHNFTLETIAKIQAALDKIVIDVPIEEKEYKLVKPKIIRNFELPIMNIYDRTSVVNESYKYAFKTSSVAWDKPMKEEKNCVGALN